MFFYMLIIFIILVIILFGTGYILRKKHYTRINELEEKKITLRERPVIDELSKVKKLKLTGQTEELFESWRASWDEIETKLFADVEEVMLEAEMNTDHYRFKSATQSENDVEQMLVIIEKQMNQILSGLKELLQSEEKNAQESKATKEKFAELRREVLARGFKLGEALPELEDELNSIANQIEKFDDLTEQGDHLEAREMILVVKKKLAEVVSDVEQIPSLLHETDKALPEEMNNLAAGYSEMSRQGYYLKQLELEQELARLNKQIEKIKENIHARQLEAAQLGIDEIHNEIELFYDTLEQEVAARSFVKENRSIVSDKLINQMKISERLAEQITVVKQTYHLTEEEMAAYLRTSAVLSELKENFTQISNLLAEMAVAYSAAQDTLKEIDAKLNQIAEEQDQISEELKSLRKDELETREEMMHMRHTIIQLSRRIERARLPGVPEEYKSLKEHMNDSLNSLDKRLEEQPLNMKAVLNDYQIAKEDLDHLAQKTDELIENARLVEQVVQYANRYRLHDEELASDLSRAETHFYNDYNYKKALEIAVTSLEKVETGAFKKIEKAYAEEFSASENE